jgi:hypothetical protein
MLPRQVAVLVAAPFMILALGGLMRGGLVTIPMPTFEGANWPEVLLKVPCDLVAKDGKDLKVNAALIVGGHIFSQPIIREEKQIRELDRRCFQKH